MGFLFLWPDETDNASIADFSVYWYLAFVDKEDGVGSMWDASADAVC
jgi:hypothetical protein